MYFTDDGTYIITFNMRIAGPDHAQDYNMFPSFNSLMSGERGIELFQIRGPADGNRISQLTLYFNTNRGRVIGITFPASEWFVDMPEFQGELIFKRSSDDSSVGRFSCESGGWNAYGIDLNEWPDDVIYSTDVHATAALVSATPEQFSDYFTPTS